MKASILLLIFFFSFNLLSAQVKKISSHQLACSYQLDLAKDALLASSTETLASKENKLLALSAHLKSNELIINYEIAHSGQKGYYTIVLEASLDDLPFQPSPGFLLGDIGLIKTQSIEKRQIIWTNIIADLPNSKGNLKITLKVDYYGPQFLAFGVECGEYPTFGFKQKAPFYAGFALGAGGLITGGFFKNKAEKNLDQHKAANTLAERAEQHQAYTDNLQTAEIVTYIGLGIIAVDTILYFIRKRKHKKRVRVFEEYCGKKTTLTVNPFIEFPTVEQPSNIGLHLSYQF